MKGRSILVLTFWSFKDALIQAYTLPYVRIMQKQLGEGNRIFLVTLEAKNFRVSGNDQEILKIQLKESGIHWVPVRYIPFGLRACLHWGVTLFRLWALILRRRISVIHCWCTTAGASGYWLSVLTGRKYVIDSYEPHAESMVETGTWKKTGMAFRILFWMERRETRRANAIISATEGMRSYALQKYGVVINDFQVKPACVDMTLFSEKDIKDKSLLAELGLEHKIVCVYAGKFGGIYLDKEVFEFLKVASEHWGDKFRVLLLTSHSREEIRSYCEQVALPDDKVLSLFVSHHHIPKYIGLGDFALTPVRPVASKRYCTPVKDGEYWAMGLPVVIPANISDDSDIIEMNSAGAVLHSLDREAYLKAVGQLDILLQQPRSETFQKIRAIATRYRSFEIAEKVYRNVYGA